MTKVVVLGGGPAGDVAGLHAAARGADVTLIEARELGGTCLNRGCIPTKALLASADVARKVQEASVFGIDIEGFSINFSTMMQRKTTVVDTMRNGVKAACDRKNVQVVPHFGVVDGDAVIAGGKRYDFDRLILCVGTSPKALPMVDMDHPRVVTSDGILELKEIPKKLLIIGGGVIGCEFASLFQTLGTEVHVIEVLPRLVNGIDKRIATQFQKLMEHQGVTFHLSAIIESITTTKKAVTVKLADAESLTGDMLLVSVGRAPDTHDIGLESTGVVLDARGWIEVDPFLQTANPRIYGAGDCIGGMQLAHLASAEAARAVDNALGIDVRVMDRTVVPSCIYTHPEIAAVGLTEDEAVLRGLKVKSTSARFLGNGKALAEAETDGLVNLVTEATTGLILGATILGPHAVESIHEIGVAISDGLTAVELGDIIHAHPTMSELIMDTAQLIDHLAPYLG